MKTIGPNRWSVNTNSGCIAMCDLTEVGPDNSLAFIFNQIDKGAIIYKKRYKQIILSPETKPNPRGNHHDSWY